MGKARRIMRALSQSFIQEGLDRKGHWRLFGQGIWPSPSVMRAGATLDMRCALGSVRWFWNGEAAGAGKSSL